MRNKIIVLIVLEVLMFSCGKEEQVQLIDSSWYLFKSTDSTRDFGKFFKYFKADSDTTLQFQNKQYIKVISFLEQGSFSENAFNPQYGVFPINNKMPIKWHSDYDTLWIGKEQFLIKTLTLDSLILQKIKDKKVTSIINTYYRIGI